MPNDHVQYDYGKAREEWGNSVADSIWSKFPSTKTQARATLDEDKNLKRQPVAGQARSVIDKIVNRSLGRAN